MQLQNLEEIDEDSVAVSLSDEDPNDSAINPIQEASNRGRSVKKSLNSAKKHFNNFIEEIFHECTPNFSSGGKSMQVIVNIILKFITFFRYLKHIIYI